MGIVSQLIGSPAVIGGIMLVALGLGGKNLVIGTGIVLIVLGLLVR